MAIYRQLGTASASRARWTDVDFIAVVRVEAGRVVILNSDGTETHLISDDESFVEGAGGLSGTVNAAVRTDESGAAVYESIEGIAVSASSLVAAGGSLFDVVAETAAQIFWREPVDMAPLVLPGAFDEALLMVPALPAFAMVDFSASNVGVVVALTPAGAIEGTEADQQSVAISGVVGSEYADVITGNGSANDLVGGSGNDTLVGGAGNDTLTLGAGDDVIRFQAGDGWDTVLDFGADGTDTIALSGFANFASFADLIASDSLVATGGNVELRLGDQDGLVLVGVTSLGGLMASSFQF